MHKISIMQYFLKEEIKLSYCFLFVEEWGWSVEIVWTLSGSIFRIDIGILSLFQYPNEECECHVGEEYSHAGQKGFPFPAKCAALHHVHHADNNAHRDNVNDRLEQNDGDGRHKLRTTKERLENPPDSEPQLIRAQNWWWHCQPEATRENWRKMIWINVSTESD